MAERDVIVLGTGLQGLSAALLLANAGAKVTLLRGPSVVMGAQADDEFHEGFALGACPHPPITISDSLLRKLGITDLPDTGHILHLRQGEDEETLTLPLSPEKAEALFGENPDMYQRFWSNLGHVALILAAALRGAPHQQTRNWQDVWHVYGTAQMLVGQPEEVQQCFADLFKLSVVDYVSLYLTSEAYQQSLVSEVVFDVQSNPVSPGSAAGLLDLAWQSMGGKVMRAGVEPLRQRLKDMCAAAGVVDMTALEPLTMLHEQGYVRGVKMTDGQEIRAARVLSDLPAPQILLDMLPDETVPFDVRVRLESEISRAPLVRLKIALNDWPPSVRDDKVLAETEYRMVTLDKMALARAYGEAQTQVGSSTPVLHVAQVEPFHEGSHRPALSVLGAYIDPSVERSTNNRLAAAKVVMDQLKKTYPDIETYISGFAVFLGSEIERIFGVQPRATTKGGAGFSGMLAQAQFWQHMQNGHGLQNLHLIGQGPESVISYFHAQDAERVTASVLSDLAL